jgi:hypothetical protein
MESTPTDRPPGPPLGCPKVGQSCPHCQESVASDAAFCEHCGQALSTYALVETPDAAQPTISSQRSDVPDGVSYLQLDPIFVESMLRHLAGPDQVQVDFKHGSLSFCQSSHRFTVQPSQLTGPIRMTWDRPHSCLNLSLESMRIDQAGVQVQLGLHKLPPS